MTKIPIAISSCLLGQPVRFDGGHKYDAWINQTLGEYFEYFPVCPEAGIGLGTPRPPIRLVKIDNNIRARGVKDPDIDVTDQLQEYARLQNEKLMPNMSGYILKKQSPSCGMERVKVYLNDMPNAKGTGIYADQIMQLNPMMPFEEEGRLGDPVLRECFVERVFIFDRIRQLSNNLSVQALTNFHAQHKFSIMSHNQDTMRSLGKLLANTSGKNLHDVFNEYATTLMKALKKPATRKNHVNVLQHIQGFLKVKLDADDKAELNETIEQYYHSVVPLIVPVTLLKHHFRKAPDPYISESFYMQPYPEQLSLRNKI